MFSNIQKFIVLGTGILIIAAGAPVLAQTEREIQEDSNSDNPRKRGVSLNGPQSKLSINKGKQKSCFDYYNFGSVKLDMSTDRTQYKPGEPVTFSGTVENMNSYPLTDVDVIARVFKEHPNPTENGNTLLVDEFNVAEGLTLGEKSKKTIKGGYTIPQNSTGGNYFINLYTTDKSRFVMSGIVFTEDVYAQRLKFSVKGNTNKKEGVYIDRARMKVNDKPHDTVGFFTEHESDKPVTVTFPLVNDSSEQKTVNLDYNLYRWSTQRKENELQYKNKTVVLSAGESTEISYTISRPSEPVYVADIAALVDQNLVSETQVRFVIQEKGRPFISAAGITGMPVTNEQEMFLCVHNMNRGLTNMKVHATLTDKQNDDVVSEIRGNGMVSGSMVGVVDTIQTETMLRNANMNISLFSNGNQVDEFQIQYRCTELPNVSCGGENTAKAVLQKGSQNMVWIFSGIVAGLIVVGGIVGIWKYVRTRQKE